jgi:hypothetical protein
MDRTGRAMRQWRDLKRWHDGWIRQIDNWWCCRGNGLIQGCVDFKFYKWMGHGLTDPWPWMLGPIRQWSQLLEGSCRSDESFNSGQTQPLNDWCPVGLGLGTPGLSGEINVEVLIVSFVTTCGNARFELTRIVWRQKSATKTNQTISLTVLVHHFGILCVLRHCFEEVHHKVLPCWNGGRQFK